MTIINYIDRCNMTYDYFINLPMSMVERQISFIIAKTPHLIKKLDGTKNHPLIRKYSYIRFNN